MRSKRSARDVARERDAMGTGKHAPLARGFRHRTTLKCARSYREMSWRRWESRDQVYRRHLTSLAFSSSRWLNQDFHTARVRTSVRPRVCCLSRGLSRRYKKREKKSKLTGMIALRIVKVIDITQVICGSGDVLATYALKRSGLRIRALAHARESPADITLLDWIFDPSLHPHGTFADPARFSHSLRFYRP